MLHMFTGTVGELIGALATRIHERKYNRLGCFEKANHLVHIDADCGKLTDQTVIIVSDIPSGHTTTEQYWFAKGYQIAHTLFARRPYALSCPFAHISKNCVRVFGTSSTLLADGRIGRV